MSNKGSCRYNSKWESVNQYKLWLKPFKSDNRKALCTACNKIIDLSNMGEGALKSHMKCAKLMGNFTEQTKSGTINMFFKTPEKISDEPERDLSGLSIPPPTPEPTATIPRPITSFVSGEEVRIAEILWTLKVITSHQSYKSSADTDKLFKKMFPDSQIGNKFSCGERKTAYLAVYGLADYFARTLKKDVTGPFVVLFDESLNKKLQEKQMDIFLRFWNEKLNQIETRYYTSQFLGHATSKYMVDHFTTAILESGLNISNLLQISMDGPNVNWKFHELIKEKINKDYNTNILNTGSCGLHIVHNSFKAGAEASGWNVSSFLSSLYYLFKDFPVRREDFKNESGSVVLPLKFVSHRWLNNVPICDRALLIWDAVNKYVAAENSKKLPDPKNKSFETVKSCIADPFFKAKLHFFRCVALQLKPFLEKYQTDRPMVSFLWDDLCAIIRSLMKRFLKSDVLSESDSNLVKIDVGDKKKDKNYKEVDMGFSVEKALKEAKASDRQILELKMEGKEFLAATLKKLLVKCPVAYSLVRYISCLNPIKMTSEKDNCLSNLKKLLHLLVNCQKVNEQDCDLIINQFSFFLEEIPRFGSEKFKEFDYKNCSIDELLYECMSSDSEKYKDLLEFVKTILTLSHGQAAVERGFSVNKQVEVENMKHGTVIAQILICDHVKSVGGILNVDINKELILSVMGARQKYETYLEQKRQEEKSTAELGKRKRILEEVSELKKRKVSWKQK